MVHITTPIPLNEDGSVNIESWIAKLNLTADAIPLIKDACQFACLTGEDQFTIYQTTTLLQGLETAEILNELQMDSESLAAAIIYSTIEHTDLTYDDIVKQMGKNIAQLVKNIQQMSLINKIPQTATPQNKQQIDNIRKMLLTIVRDVRVVVIKLAERLFIMRALRHCDNEMQRHVAQTTMTIFAPLANRLGLHHLKWQLEDLSFNYLEPIIYKDIAKKLAERRADRDQRVKKIISILNSKLQAAHISADVHGRAKHIYSIRRKMLHKNINLTQIYDTIAVRVLVNTIKECYEVLGIVHETWQPIPAEFDDYISAPKANGYQSIHTAVIDNDDHKNFEVQIRTQKMHEDSEKGVAAHWKYKEGTKQQTSYEEKINWLRDLLEWQKEMARDAELPQQLEKNIFEDQVYVFTPTGQIIDLPAGATPLDFAYQIHTEIGHRCKGVKVNRKIVPLTYKLKTGDQIEVLTSKTNNPSRDWLITQRGYLKTPGARAKVLQWFKQQGHTTYIEEGKNILERELQKLDISEPNLTKIAKMLNFKSTELMYAALGSNSIRPAKIINLICKEQELSLIPKAEEKIETIKPKQIITGKNDITIQEVGDLLSRIAKCCKPVPGDKIVGYITRGHGVTIHRHTCNYLNNLQLTHPDRIIAVTWNYNKQQSHPVDLEILAHDRAGIARDITSILANEQINITNLNFAVNKKANALKCFLTIIINNIDLLEKIIAQLSQIPNIYSVKRAEK